jgi:hypothetical protein
MNQPTLNPAEIKAPAHLTRAEKAAFRRYLAALPARNEPLPASFADDVADYVQMRSRIAWLQKMLRHETSTVPHLATKPSLQISAQINSAIGMAQKIADRLQAHGAPASD